MFHSLLTVIPLILFTFDVSAKPLIMGRSPITLPITRRLNLTSAHNLLRHDQARARALKAKGTAKALRISLDNNAVVNEGIDNQEVAYIASVGVGSPPTTCTFIFVKKSHLLIRH